MSGITSRTVQTNGVTLRVTEAGEGFPVVLCHGFPETAYSWRHQVRVLAGAGYRVLAPDQRGFGGSSIPAEVEEYRLDELAADVVGLLDDVGAEQGVFVGHDWGSPVVWHAALTFPQRVRAVASLSVPYAPRGSRPPLEVMREAAGPEHIHYVDYFQEPGVVDREFGENPRESLLGFLWSISGDAPREERFTPIAKGRRFLDSLTVPAHLPPWLTEADLQEYVDSFARTGFSGGLNWYRNSTRNWEDSARLAGAKVTQPALFITGSRDPARNPSAIERLAEWVPKLMGSHLLMGCGHWTQQERPEEVNALLLEWLGKVV